MQKVRTSQSRGYTDLGWLKGYHSFSFANYYDPEHMSWGNLRVINEDRIEPGQGFPTHGHRDMEIISYTISGGLEHKDSLGNSVVIPQGDVQRMSAGAGVLHSEYNPDRRTPNHFLQIWITPEKTGIRPSYEQKTFTAKDKTGALILIASPNGADGSLTINADATLRAAILEPQTMIAVKLNPARKAYVQLISGALRANGEELHPGDALLIDGEAHLTLSAEATSEVLLFDLSA